MFNELKKLVKQTAVYGLGNISSSLINFLLLPIYTRLLTTADYGILELLVSFTAIVSLFLNAGINTALFKVYFRDCKSEAQRYTLLSTALLFLMAFSGLIYIIIFLNHSEIAGWLLGQSALGHYIRLISLTMILNIFLVVPFALFRAQGRAGRYVSLSLAQLGLTLILNIYFVIILRWGILGILYAGLGATILVNLIILPHIFSHAGFRFSILLLKKILYFGLPLIPAGIGFWIINSSNRYFLYEFTTLDIVGLYGVGYKLSMILQILIISPFQLAWPPVLFKLADKNDAQNIYAHILTYYIFILLFISLGIILFSNEILKIMTAPAFWQAKQIIPWITIALVFNGINTILLTGLWLKDKIQFLSLAVGIAAIVNIFLNLILIPQYQMYGAAFAMLGAYLILSLLLLFISQKYYFIPYQYSRIGKLFILFSILVILGGQLPEINLYFIIPLKLLIWLALIPLLYLANFYSQKELIKLKEYIRF